MREGGELKGIQMSGNVVFSRLTTLEKSGMEGLESITISDSLFSREDVLVLERVIESASDLVSLDLTNSGVDFRDLEPTLSRRFRHLSLKGQPLLRRLPKVRWERLPAFQGLETLSLHRCGFTSETCDSLAQVLLSCPVLRLLDLSHNPLSTGFGQLLPVLQTLNLRVLILASTRLGTALGVALISAIWKSDLEHLDLTNNSLKDAVAVQLEETWPKSLTHLYLSYNEISDIGIEKLRKVWNGLKRLYIDHNDLSREAFSQIPREDAEALSIRNARCGDIYQLTALNMTYLDVSWSSISTLILTTPVLDTLCLVGTRLSPEGIMSLKGLRTLKNLDLTACALVPNHHIDEVLPLMGNLRKLGLGNNDLGDVGIEAVWNGVQTCTELREFDIGNNGISSSGWKDKGCERLTYIESFRVNTNCISDTSHLRTFLSLQIHLRELDLSRASLTSTSLVLISYALATCPLATLILSGNDFHSPGNALHTLNCLRVLELANCHLGHLSLGWVWGLIPDTLKDLSLFRNPMGLEGAAQLHELLPRLSQLYYLNLHKCDLGDSGLELLCPNLSTMVQLRELLLGWNSLTSACLPSLSAALLMLTHLESLSLVEALLDDPRTEALFSGLPVSLNKLDLAYTNLSSNSIQALLAKIREMDRLTWCSIVGQRLDSDLLHNSAIYPEVQFNS